MKSYETYIFDLDGTITDTMAVWLDILRASFIHFGITPSDDKTLAFYSHDWTQLKHVGFPEEKFDQLAQFIYKLANKRLPEAEFHNGAYEVLETLKNKGKRLAVYSSLDKAIFEPAMQYRNLYPLVDAALAGTDITHRKPHPEGILKVLDVLNISSDLYKTVVYVGDKDTDIQAAHSARIASILYYPIAHSLFYNFSDLKKYNPTHIITDWQELLV